MNGTTISKDKIYFIGDPDNNIEKEIKLLKQEESNKNAYILSLDKKGLLRYFGEKKQGEKWYYVYLDEFTEKEKEIYKILLNEKNDDNSELELKYHRWGFKSPDINNLKTKTEKDKVYNKILNQFKEELKDWLYK